MNRLRAIGVLFVFCVAAGAAAQDPLAEWKGRSRKAGRWEGIAQQNAGNPPFELRSFVATSPAAFPEKSFLEAWFFHPPNSTVTVLALELDDFQSYRMQSSPVEATPSNPPRWGRFATWPTVDVIDELQLDARNVGVVAYVGNSLGALAPEVTPAYLFASKPLQSREKAIASLAAASQYLIALRPSATLDDVSCIVTSSTRELINVRVPGRVLGRAPFRCVIPHAALRSNEGLLTLTVIGRTLSQALARFQLTFHHHVPPA